MFAKLHPFKKHSITEPLCVLFLHTEENKSAQEMSKDPCMAVRSTYFALLAMQEHREVRV